MKKILSLLITTALVSLQGITNVSLADDGADVFINLGEVGTIDFSGRAFGGESDPVDIVDLLGGRVLANDSVILGGKIRKIKRGNKKIYVTLELDNSVEK